MASIEVSSPVSSLVVDASSMATSPAILRLPDELIRDILDQIEADPEKLVNLDRRSYLSQEKLQTATATDQGPSSRHC